MRDIMFRGKRIDNGEWVEGYYVALPDAVGMTHMIHVPRSDPDDSNRTYFIDPDTLGQYIGLTDKNGRKIFEDDIIAVHNTYHNEEEIKGFVEYGIFNCSCCRGVYGWYLEDGDIRGLGAGTDYYVIGNIYDTPQLIGAEKE